jgi:1-acyl-sn-glycerol-3-phosphate acyltransferase
MILLILEFFAVAALEHGFFLLLKRERNGLNRRKSHLIRNYSKRALGILNVGVRFHPETHPWLKGGLIVCNHLSYIDVLVISSCIPTLYITSVETGSSGWIGAICRIAGCLFVERRKVTALRGEVTDIHKTLSSGLPIVLFPEATSSDGCDVLPFKSSLFECALRSKVPIHSLCLKYAPRGPGIPYHGDMTLLPHLFSLCDGLPRIATLDFLDTLDPSDTLERKGAARTTHLQIRKAYVSRMGRTQKTKSPAQPEMLG